jgi:RNA recognition motif-containing protein
LQHERLYIERILLSHDEKKNPAHFRLFVGDLAPEVSDDGLAAAFSKWSSFVKARVVRDKVTTKSKGYGFVSYKDPEDFMKAWKEMNGKYVGSRPIKISKATTKVGVVQIGNKKARHLDDHRKKKLIQGVERLRTGAGAVWKNDNRPYARR